MKKIVTIILLAIIGLSVTAQTSSTTPLSVPDWIVSGNTLTADGWLGTVAGSPYNVIFVTNGYERARILSSSGSTGGYFGIGTTSPVRLLNIYGGSSDLAQLRLSGNNGNMGIEMVDASSSGYYNWQIGAQNEVANSFTITPSTAANGTTFTTPVMTILSSGNVGIGTTTPAYNLDVTGDFRVSTYGVFGGGYVIGNTQSYGMYWGNHNNGYLSFPSVGNATIMNANLGIGTISPNASSLLDVYSSNKGVLIPSIALTSSTDASTIANPATSLLVYNPGTGGLSPAGYYYNAGTSGSPNWVSLATGNNGWLLIGNGGTTPGTNFMGTTDNEDVVFKRQGQQAGLLNEALYNTSWGVNALNPNTTGNSNVAIGNTALAANSTGSANVAIGTGALYANTTGSSNTAIGPSALNQNQTIGTLAGNDNTAVGLAALSWNTTGSKNTSIGEAANGWNNTGSENTALGYYAAIPSTLTYTNLNQCTFIGAYTGCPNTALNYATALGYGATVNFNESTAIGYAAVTTQANQVFIGNTNTGATAACLLNAWSDGRFKFNIQQNVKGLEFIKKLRPVTYQMNTQALDSFVVQNMSDSVKIRHKRMSFAQATAVVHAGFIAQQVDSAAIACGFTSSIVHRPANSADPYALAYSEIVVPLVKAVQELSRTIDSLKQRQKTTDSLMSKQKKIDSLQVATLNNLLFQQKTTDSLLTVLQNCCATGATNKTMQNYDNEQGNATSIHDIELANNAVLYQNAPNPFGEGTTIKYFVPDNANAQIVFYDDYGNQIKAYNIAENGMGQLNVEASNLSAGMYSYSLIISGKIIDTKKMIRQ